jgi:hypothetical protein
MYVAPADEFERLQLALDADAITWTWIWDILAGRFTADERFARLFGLSTGLISNRTVARAIDSR